MTKTAALVALATVLLAGVTTAARAKQQAAPPINYGVADNTSFFADDGGSWFYGQLAGANLTQNRWEMQWDASNPTTVTQLAFLQRAAPKAQAAGVHVVLVLDSKRASDHDPRAFCTWAAGVASVAKVWGIHDFVVWNEPNTSLFWSPQDANAPAAYEELLANCYDAIHLVDAQARVIGFGLSPRSNGPSQTAPIPFLAAAAAAYKASGRTTPIMDQLSIHPYPNPNSPADSPDVGYANTSNYGIPNLDRVKQAIYDGFKGTGQPTTLTGLTIRIDELGWQTDTTAYSQYYNAENVNVVSEQTQADYMKEAVQKYFACDPTVTDVDWFLLVDEATRNGRSADGSTVLGGGWQSGLLTAGGQGVSAPKLAYAQLAAVLAQGRSACTGAQVNWQPAGTTTTPSTPSGPTVGGTGLLGGNSPTPGLVTDQGGFKALYGSSSTQAAQQVENLYVNYFNKPADMSGLAALAGSLGSMSSLLAGFPPLNGPALLQVGAADIKAQVTINQLQQAIGRLSRFGMRSTSSARAAAPVLLAAGSANVAAGAKPAARLKVLRPKAKPPAGTYYLLVILKSKADPSKRITVALPYAHVKPAKKPKKH